MNIRHYSFLFLLVFSTQVLLAQNSIKKDILMNADNMTRNLKNKTVTLSGNVNVVFKDQHLSCDNAQIFLDKNFIIAQGNVVFITPKTYSESSKVEYDYKTELGTFYESFIQSGNVTLEGNIIRKNGPIEYFVEDAKISSCMHCPATWSFTGKTIDAQLEGYAYVKYPFLNIFDIPVFFLPAILIPLKSDRQSGLLPPSWASSTNHGFTFSQSYFWAISRSQDLTFTLKNYDLNGLKTMGHYRYVLSNSSSGELKTAHILDKKFKKLNADGSESNQREDRWFFSYNHIFKLPDNYTQRVDINLIGDLSYLKDYTDELDGYGDSALENKISLTKNYESLNWNIETDYYLNLLQDNSEDHNNFSVHRFPEFNLTTSEQEIKGSGLFVKFKTQYLNVDRNGFSYDDVCPADGSGGVDCADHLGKISPINDGSYDPAVDILRTGHRLDIQPEIYYPLSVGNFLNIMPAIKYRETFYRFNALTNNPEYSNTTQRRYIETSLSIKSQFYRKYLNSNNNNIQAESTNEVAQVKTRYVHKIEPEIYFSQIPAATKPDHPFFGDFDSQPRHLINSPISENDFTGNNKVQFDYHDRIFNQKYIQLGLINRVTRARGERSNSTYKDVLKFGVFQSYDFIEGESKDNPQPLSPVRTLLDIRMDHFETLTTYDLYTYAGVENVDSRVKLLDNRGDFVELRYNRSYSLDENNQVALNTKSEHYALRVGGVTKHLNLTALADYNTITNELQEWSATALIKLPGNCWNIILKHKSVLNSDSVTSYYMDFNFGGDKFKQF